ncbi:MAG: DUF4445 domain-containing protein [Verrucomicrobia bacterium]|jgi:uncharacterized 2Fe-2S/4Fe-4S cluster protein (DUF4445 family)|nr:DUF4445 domain-containing protein [Verrucomicrobiota bacterium]MBT7065501.1 DUF4445 domain-containing protein [Verrucomicrobiota bacterium]MBT7698888.1 DUF4445 domain-containing protein [Verrucomicrobiota bacterium]
MQGHEIKVTFQPTGRSVFVLPETVLLEAAGRAGIILQTPCGGRGSCGKCRVRLVDAPPDPSPASIGTLTPEQVAQGYRLACCTAVTTPLVVEIPAESTFESTQQILTADSGADVEVAPLVHKKRFTLPPPSSEDPRADLPRLQAALGDISVSPTLMRVMSGFLRDNDWQGTAVLSNHHLVALEPGDTTADGYGVAVDLGSTTVVGKLFDLVSGRECAVASQINPQVTFGDDVISRIMHLREHDDGLAELQAATVACLNAIVSELVAKADVRSDEVYEIVLAGNSTMQQIFCGYDPSALGEVPFVQAFEEAQILSAASLGLKANVAAEVYVFPQIGSFVGGDTVAGIVAARLDQWDEPVLFVDIGTNGEIVLANGDQLLATSTAAGPAFEGARIRQGMRAATGAIEKVIIRDDVAINVIGDAPPAGLCGTALIDAAAELLRAGIIDETGRILPVDELPAGVAPALQARLVTEGHETRFMLASEAEAAGDEAIYLWQKDVRELQLATGAVRAGVQIMLRRAGLEADAIHRVLLAGAFGNFIRRSNARRIGLLPQISGDRIRFIGNAASLGAKLVLLSDRERDYAARLQTQTEHIDLSLDPEFQMEFGMAMIFPSADFDACED